MKLSVVNTIAGMLSGMKINRISDKDVKATLVNDYLHLRKFAKEADEERNELVEKFQKDWADVMPIIGAMREKNELVIGHDDYLEAEKDANKAIGEIFARDVDAKPKAVPVDAFVAAFGEEELTLEQIAFLQENGLIE